MTKKGFEVWEEEPAKKTTKSEVKITEKQLDINTINDLFVRNELIRLYKENNQLKQENEYFKELLDRYEIEVNDFDKFMNNREHTRLSINLETNELQRHIYSTGNWFGDFDRVLVKKWLDEESYHRFIDRVIEVFNTEFKKELK